MTVVVEPVRIAGVRQPRDKGTPMRTRQPVSEKIDSNSRQPEPRKQQEVIDDNGMKTDGKKGSSHQRGQDDRVGQRQGQALGIKDVRVEEMLRIGEQLVVDPS